MSRAHRDLHVLTHSFPTRRSSDLLYRCRGVVTYGQICQHQGIASSDGGTVGAAMFSGTEGTDRPSVHELDAAATGMPRQPMLARLIGAGDRRVLRDARSDERRGGEEGDSSCSFRWS